MKPLMLHGHERSITQIKYNREGDLLFSCAKDSTTNIWFSLNGERLGTLEGHTGACWCIDVNWDTTKVVTGSADNTCRIWDCQTGKSTSILKTKTGVRSCGFSYSGNMLMYTTDKTMGHPCEVHVFDIRDNTQIENSDPMLVMTVGDSKITSGIWGPLDEFIITGHENGMLCQWDIKSGDLVQTVREHSQQINDIQASKNLSMLVTASKDCTAKLFDTASLQHKKTYKTERPVNSAAISPIREHVALGGGQEAMDVTTTSARIGKFDARFYHLIFEEEFGRVKGHFGPINSVAFHPDGKSFSTGGEDGYVRVQSFDPQYYQFDFEY